MKLGKLIIFSGLPGTGKSTLASRLSAHLSATYLRIDTIEQGLRDICEISQIDGKGYELAHRIARENLLHGNSVVADCVNPWDSTRKAWNAVAEEVGAQFFNVEIICSNEEEHRRRVESREISGLVRLTWEEVRTRDYHPWGEGRVVVDTFGKGEDAGFRELVEVVGV